MNAKTLERRFSIERIVLLLRNRIYEETPAVGIVAAIVFVGNILSLWVSHQAFFNAPRRHGAAWIATIAVGGLFIAGNSFKDMHDGKAGTEWLLLPATPLEKYAAAFLDSVVVFPVAGAPLCLSLSAFLELISRVLGGVSGTVWMPLDSGTIRAWAAYAIAAAVFLAGSASFRKIPILKTIGVASVFFLVVAGLVMVGARVLFGGGNGAAMNMDFFNGEFTFDVSKVSQRAQDVVRLLFDVARYAILPAFAILFGASKVIEKEGLDEVQ